MTRLYFLLLACVIAVTACAKSTQAVGEQTAADPTTEEDKTFYALGMAIAESLEQYDLSAAELKMLQAGLNAVATDSETVVSLDDYRARISELSRERSAAAKGREKQASIDFLEKMAAEPDARKFESGLIMIELEPGTGPNPVAEDTVQVHYHGTLRDGSVFDSSVERGTPATFPLTRVIACWTEGVQKIKVGGKARLVCPSEIAYGDRGSPPRIPPGAALVFEVELLAIQ